MSFEAFILDGLENIGQFDFDFAIKLLVVALGIIWIFTTYWVWKDSEERIISIPVRIIVTLLVLPFNFIALIAYLLSRPRNTFESEYWGDLEKRYLQYETADLRDCENCGYDLQPGFQYCPVCGYATKIECESCGEMIDMHWNFCPFCRTQQRETLMRQQYEESRDEWGPKIVIPTREVPKTENAYEDQAEEKEASESEIFEAEEKIFETHDTEIREGEEKMFKSHKAEIKEDVIQEDEITEEPAQGEPEITNEPQPEFGLDSIMKRPELRKERPEKQFINIGRSVLNPPERRKKELSLPTKIGKFVIKKVSLFGKQINDTFVTLVRNLRSIAQVAVPIDQENNITTETDKTISTIDELENKVLDKEETDGEEADRNESPEVNKEESDLEQGTESSERTEKRTEAEDIKESNKENNSKDRRRKRRRKKRVKNKRSSR